MANLACFQGKKAVFCLQMLKVHSPVIEVVLRHADGTETVARRCGPFPDRFASRNGVIYSVETPATGKINGHLAIKYHKACHMLRYMVADAWMPGWDDTKEEQKLGYLDGDANNCSIDNLAVKVGGKGRPRDSKQYQKLKAAMWFRDCPDIEAIGDELGLKLPEVVEAVRLHAPDLIHLLPKV